MALLSFLFGGLFLSQTAVLEPPHISISEVMWMGSDQSVYDEWVEIANVRDAAADIGGWTLTSLDSNSQEKVIYTFPEAASLAPREYAIVSHYAASASRLAIDPRFVAKDLALPNTKLLLRIRDASGTLMDEVDDGVGVPFAGLNPSGAVKASMERKDLLAPGNELTNWATASENCGFDAGAQVQGTPGVAWGACSVGSSSQSSASSVSSSSDASVVSSEMSSNSSVSSIEVEPFSSSKSENSSSSNSSAYLSSESASSAMPNIRITEVLPDTDGDDDASFVEIGNSGLFAQDIAGWSLRLGSKSFVIPRLSSSGTQLVPGGYVAFRKSQTGLSLTHDGGTVSLLRENEMKDSLTYPALPLLVSYGRMAGEESGFRVFCVPTEGLPNVVSEWNPSIHVQSGTTRGVDKVTLNVEMIAPEGIVQPGACTFDYGDGTHYETCNPPSHTYSSFGFYTLRATATNYCTTTVIRSMSIQVDQEATTSGTQAETYSTLNASTSSSHSSVSPALRSLGEAGLASSASSHPRSSSSTCYPSPSPDLHLDALYPNPPGDDVAGEWISLQNSGSEQLSLCGYGLSTGAKSTAVFTFTDEAIPGSGSIILPRSKTHLLLRNGSDIVRLLVRSGTGWVTLDTLSYKKAPEGKVIGRTGKISSPVVFAESEAASESSPDVSSNNSDQEIAQEEGLESISSSSKSKKSTAKKRKTAKVSSTAYTADLSGDLGSDAFLDSSGTDGGSGKEFAIATWADMGLLSLNLIQSAVLFLLAKKAGLWEELLQKYEKSPPERQKPTVE